MPRTSNLTSTTCIHTCSWRIPTIRNGVTCAGCSDVVCVLSSRVKRRQTCASSSGPRWHDTVVFYVIIRTNCACVIKITEDISTSNVAPLKQHWAYVITWRHRRSRVAHAAARARRHFEELAQPDFARELQHRKYSHAESSTTRTSALWWRHLRQLERHFRKSCDVRKHLFRHSQFQEAFFGLGLCILVLFYVIIIIYT